MGWMESLHAAHGHGEPRCVWQAVRKALALPFEGVTSVPFFVAAGTGRAAVSGEMGLPGGGEGGHA